MDRESSPSVRDNRLRDAVDKEMFRAAAPPLKYIL